MKILKKTLILMLALLMALVSFAGCGVESGDGGNNNTPGGNPPGSNPPSGPSIPPVEETELYLVRESRSDYKLVIESDAKDTKGYEAYAAQELKANFNAATGIQLDIVQTSEVTVSNDSKLIIIGDTSLTQTAGVKADKNVYGVRGFVIKTIDSNVYIVGGAPMGTLYGVYEFLHQQFGYEPYASNEIYLEKNVSNKLLKDFDMKEIPDIAHMQATYEYWGFGNRMAGHRMRFNEYDEIFIGGDNQPWHNTFDMYVHPNEYADTHPDWYSSTKKQLHYTANGNPTELKALQDTVIEKMKGYIDADFAKGLEYEMIGFMAQDGMNTFEKDPAYVAKYGSKASVAAMIIHFINPIQEAITQYMEDEYDGKPMHVTFFAYVEAQTPPVERNEKGEWVPMDESVMVHPDANVFIAPIYQDYAKDFGESEVKDIADGWNVLTENSSFWFYEYYFSYCSMTHLDSTYGMQSYMQGCYDMGAEYIFWETPLGAKQYYVFGKLKTYLMSKLGWDVHANVDTLIDDFFKNYYKQAAGPMREYFDSLTAYCALLRDTVQGYSGVCSSNMNQAKYWQQGVLEQWLHLLDKAYEAIEPLKSTDKELYNELYARINYDTMSPRFLLLSHHAKTAFKSDIEFQEELASLKADAASHGCVYWADFGGGQTFANFNPVRG